VSDQKFCVNCANYERPWCLRRTGEINLVTGEPMLKQNVAECERDDAISTGRCGVEAKYFQPFPEKPKPTQNQERINWLVQEFHVSLGILLAVLVTVIAAVLIK
jgi:hypothetical protein